MDVTAFPPSSSPENQREGLIAGLTEVLYEVGYQKTTVSLIGQRAAVSKSDFYKHFESKDDCFFAAYEAAIERIREQVTEACAEHGADEWSARVCDGTRCAARPLSPPTPPSPASPWSRACAPAAASTTATRRAVESFVAYLRDGAPAAPDGDPVPAATDEAVVGGIASLLGRRILAGEEERIDELLPDVLEFALTPYLGAAEARRIISAG